MGFLVGNTFMTACRYRIYMRAKRWNALFQRELEASFKTCVVRGVRTTNSAAAESNQMQPSCGTEVKYTPPSEASDVNQMQPSCGTEAKYTPPSEASDVNQMQFTPYGAETLSERHSTNVSTLNHERIIQNETVSDITTGPNVRTLQPFVQRAFEQLRVPFHDDELTNGRVLPGDDEIHHQGVSTQVLREYMPKLIDVDVFFVFIGAFRHATTKFQKFSIAWTFLRKYNIDQSALGAFVALFTNLVPLVQTIRHQSCDAVLKELFELTCLKLQSFPIPAQMLKLIAVVINCIFAMIGVPSLSILKNFKKNLSDASKLSKDLKELSDTTYIKQVVSMLGLSVMDAEKEMLQSYIDQGLVLDSRIDNICLKLKEDPSSVYDNIKDVVDLCENILEYKKEVSAMKVVAKTSFSTFYSSLLKKFDLFEQLRQQVFSLDEKQVPTILYIYGESDCGKSTMANCIMKKVCEKLGLPFSVYARTVGDEYWSGYKGQTCIVYDDFLSRADCKDALEFLTLASCANEGLNMAGLAEKGTKFTSKFIVCCSNSKGLLRHNVMTNPEALDRRRDVFVEMCGDRPKEFDASKGYEWPHTFFYHLAKKRTQHKEKGIIWPRLSRFHGFDDIVSILLTTYRQNHAKFTYNLRNNIFAIEGALKPQFSTFNDKSDKKTYVFMGPPGVGKSHLARQTELIVFDDPTDSEETMEKAINNILVYYDTGLQGSLLTVNPGAWDKFWLTQTAERRSKVMRRINLVNFNFTRKSRFSLAKYSRSDIEKAQRAWDTMVDIDFNGVAFSSIELMLRIQSDSAKMNTQIDFHELAKVAIEPGDMKRFDLSFKGKNPAQIAADLQPLIFWCPSLALKIKNYLNGDYELWVPDLLLRINNAKLAYEGDPCVITSEGEVFVGFSLDGILHVVQCDMYHPTLYEERGCVMTGIGQKSRIANTYERNVFSHLFQIVVPPVEVEQSELSTNIQFALNLLFSVCDVLTTSSLLSFAFGSHEVDKTAESIGLESATPTPPTPTAAKEASPKNIRKEWSEDLIDDTLDWSAVEFTFDDDIPDWGYVAPDDGRGRAKSGKNRPNSGRRVLNGSDVQQITNGCGDMRTESVTATSVFPPGSLVHEKKTPMGSSYEVDSNFKHKIVRETAPDHHVSLTKPSATRRTCSGFGKKYTKTDFVNQRYVPESAPSHALGDSKLARQVVRTANWKHKEEKPQPNLKDWFSVSYESGIVKGAINCVYIEDCLEFEKLWLPLWNECAGMKCDLHEFFKKCGQVKKFDSAKFAKLFPEVYAQMEKKPHPGTWRICGPCPHLMVLNYEGENLLGKLITEHASDTGPKPEQMSDQMLYDSMACVMKQMCKATGIKDLSVNTTYGIMLDAHHVLLPGHLIDAAETVKITFNDVEYTCDQFLASKTKDFGIGRFEKAIPKASAIVNKFIQGNIADPEGKTIFLNLPIRGTTMHLLQASRFVTHMKYGGKLGYKYSPILIGGQTYGMLTQDGDCGSPLFLGREYGAQRLLGIHTAGSKEVGIVTVVTQGEIKGLMNLILKHQSNGENDELIEMRLVESDRCAYCEPIELKLGIVRVGNVYNQDGTRRSGYVSGKTQLRKSPLAINSPEFIKVEPAALGKNDVRVPSGDRIMTGLDKFAKFKNIFDSTLLANSFEQISDWYIQLLKKHNKTLRVFSDLEAVNRNTAYESSNPLNRGSSGGWPYSTLSGVQGKKPMLGERADGLYQIDRSHPYGELLFANMTRLHNDCYNGRSPFLPTTCCLKDEARPLAKIAQPRLFYAFPLHGVLFGRKYMGAMQSVISELHNEQPIKIGICAQGTDWHVLYNQLNKISGFGFDADYSGFDISINSNVFEGVKYFYNALYKACDPNWKQGHDLCRNGFYTAIQYPHTIIHGGLYQLPSSHPSGQPGTAFDNSLINLSYVYTCCRYASIDTRGTDVTFSNFLANVGLVIYGDDLLLTVSDEFQLFFTFHSFKYYVMKYFGMTVTPGSKDSAAQDIIPLRKMTFLKRHFVFQKNLWTGGLANEAFSKILSHFRSTRRWHYDREAEPDLLELDLVQDIAQVAMREAVLRGERFFLGLRRHLQGCDDKYNLGLDLSLDFDCCFCEIFGFAKISRVNIITESRTMAIKMQSSNAAATAQSMEREQSEAQRAPPVPVGDPIAGLPIEGTPTNDTARVSNDVVGAIKHIQSVQKIVDFMYDMLILTENITWNSTDLAGRVLFQKPVTPLQNNSFIAHLAQIHNAWTGSMQYQMYINGTGFNAGKVMLVWTPPNINASKLSLIQLTGFPNTIIDVKNLNPVDFESKDQNPRMFHYLSDPSDIGGNVSVVVFSRLISSSGLETSVEIQLRECVASDFEFLEPIPPTARQSLVAPQKIVLHGSHHAVIPGMASPLLNMHVQTSHTITQGTDVLNPDVAARLPFSIHDFEFKPTPSSNTGGITLSNGNALPSVHLTWLPHAAKLVGCSGGAVTNYPLVSVNFNTMVFQVGVAFSPETGSVGFRSEASSSDAHGANTAGPMYAVMPNESVIIFSYADEHGMPTTSELLQLMRNELIVFPAGSAALYSLVRRTDGSLLRYVKLYATGVMSTTRVTAVVTIPLNDMELQFVGFISEDGGIPSTPQAVQRTLGTVSNVVPAVSGGSAGTPDTSGRGAVTLPPRSREITGSATSILSRIIRPMN